MLVRYKTAYGVITSIVRSDDDTYVMYVFVRFFGWLTSQACELWQLVAG